MVGDGLLFNAPFALFVKKRQGVLQQVLRPGTTVHPSGRQIQAIRLSRDTFVFTESLVSVRISRLFYADFCQHALLNLSCILKRLQRGGEPDAFVGLLASMELGYPNGRIPMDNPILGRALWHYDDIIVAGNYVHAAVQTEILVCLLPRWNHDSDYRKAHVPRQTLKPYTPD